MRIQTKEQPTPTKRFTGADFEQLVNERCKEFRHLGIADVAKYGVMASVIGRDKTGKADVVLKKSFPDFEGPINLRGQQAIFDCKVESSASFSLSRYAKGLTEAKRLQLTKMYSRAEFGCVCFFLIHWNPRELKTKAFDPITYAFPVRRDHPFWDGFERGEESSINREHCGEYAIEVPWNTIDASRTARPDFMVACEKMMNVGGGSRVVGSWG